MYRIRQGFSAALLVATIALALPAYAEPIPVGTSKSDDLWINFDFSSANPAPPYVSVPFTVLFSWGAGGNLIWDFCEGLNGTGACGSVYLGAFLSDLSGSFLVNDYGFLDGQFSFGFRLASGAADVTGATATGVNAAGARVTINGNVVPEPGSLALLGIGLAGLCYARRRSTLN